MSKLNGKTALVSGSGRGIGRAVAEKLAAEGARVVVNDLDPDTATEAAEKIQAMGGEAIACSGDVTAPDFGERFVKAAVDAFGGVDIVVNNAGYTWDNVIQKMSDEQWSEIVDLHLGAPFRILRAAQPVISAAVKAERAAGRDVPGRRVVNISSIAGLYGAAGQLNYASAKMGIVGLTRSLAKEWGRYNVTVNAVAFGIIRTRLTVSTEAEASIDIKGRGIKVGINADVLSAAEKQIPLGRAGTPEEGAGAVYLFCTPEAGYVTGECLICSGGF